MHRHRRGAYPRRRGAAGPGGPRGPRARGRCRWRPPPPDASPPAAAGCTRPCRTPRPWRRRLPQLYPWRWLRRQHTRCAGGYRSGAGCTRPCSTPRQAGGYLRGSRHPWDTCYGPADGATALLMALRPCSCAVQPAPCVQPAHGDASLPAWVAATLMAALPWWCTACLPRCCTAVPLEACHVAGRAWRLWERPCRRAAGAGAAGPAGAGPAGRRVAGTAGPGGRANGGVRVQQKQACRGRRVLKSGPLAT
jgi:hypothetical protein